MGPVEAVVLGIVQGLTEWLPISSTAHLRIVPALLGWSDPGAGFTAVIQLGTTVAVMIYLWQDIRSAFLGWFNSVFMGKDRNSHEAKMGWAVFLGTLPIIVVGLLLKHPIEKELRSLYVIATTMMVGAVLMLVAERLGSQKRAISTAEPKDGLIFGLWQCLALIPGMSRSGSTISGGLLAGFDRATAARFSFLMSFPSVAGAGLFELYQDRHELAHIGWMETAIATVVAFGVGYWSIALLIRYLQKNSLVLFVVYRIALGVLLLFLLQSGTTSPDAGAGKPPAGTAATTQLSLHSLPR